MRNGKNTELSRVWRVALDAKLSQPRVCGSGIGKGRVVARGTPHWSAASSLGLGAENSYKSLAADGVGKR